MDSDAGRHAVLDRLDDYAAVNGIYRALEDDPASEGAVYGDLSVFRFDDDRQPVVFEGGENRFWTDEEVAQSFFGRLDAERISRVRAYRPWDDHPEPAEYAASDYEDNLQLLADLYWDEQGSVLVFQRRGDRDPLVYDTRDDAVLRSEEYYNSMMYAMDAAYDESAFVEMIDEVEDRVAEFRPLSHIRYTAPGRNRVPSVMGFAGDGEGFALARARGAPDGEMQYVMARTRYDRDEPGGTRTEFDQELRFDRRTLPSESQMRDRNTMFGRDHIIRKHADRPGEAVTALEEAYLLDSTTRL